MDSITKLDHVRIPTKERIIATATYLLDKNKEMEKIYHSFSFSFPNMQ